MGSVEKQVDRECLPYVRVYTDDTVDHLSESPIVLPSIHDLETGVTSKDIKFSIDPPISARMYLPKSAIDGGQKLPIMVYFHDGGFCFESAFSLVETKLMNNLASKAKLIAVSIEYRLAPENPMPVVYDDCWTGLQWVASHFGDGGKDLWIKSYDNFYRFFIDDDSARGTYGLNSSNFFG